MKILLVHNFYRSSAPSGEDLVFKREVAFLRQQPGWEVILHVRCNDELNDAGWTGLAKVALQTPWNQGELKEVRSLIERHKPDIMHVHNLFPQISGAIMHAAEGTNTATIQTLHNYRKLCSNGLLLRDGKICTECPDSNSVLPGLVHRCYRNSLLATLPVAATIGLHRLIGTWHTCMDAFIAFTEFQRDLLIKGGIPGELIHIKPNWMASPGTPLPWDKREKRVIFLGRITREKGVDVLVDAWKLLGADAPALEIVGNGQEFDVIKRDVERHRLPVIMSGYLRSEQAAARVRTASLMVVPSVCFEGFGLSVLEAKALGVPVLASDLGSLPVIVHHGTDGEVFHAGNPQALADAVRRLMADPRKLEQMGQNARANFEAQYTETAHLQSLLKIYAAAIAHRRARQSAPSPSFQNSVAASNRPVVDSPES